MNIPSGAVIGGGLSIPIGKDIVNEERIDYRARQSVFLGARFIFECGTKVEATPMVVATALHMYHRFFKQVEMKDYDVYLIGSTSLYLAGKVENQHLRVRDIINVSHTSIHRNNPAPDLGGPIFSALKEAVFQAELLMMRILKFKIVLDHPHKYLTHYLKTIEEWVGFDISYKTPVARTSWAVLQDFHHDPSVVDYAPEALAIAAIQIALKVYNFKIPLCPDEGKKSWPMIMYPDYQPDIQMEIQEKMIKAYERESEHLAGVTYKENLNGK